jgi:hypothetical protein
MWLQACSAVRARFQTVLNVGILESTSFTICRILIFVFEPVDGSNKECKASGAGARKFGPPSAYSQFFSTCFWIDFYR